MNFQQSLKVCIIDKPFNWKDRASRSEFWWFFIPAFIAGAIAAVLNDVPGIGQTIAMFIYGVAWWLLTVAAIRRLHDTNKSGFWLLFPTGAALLGVNLIIAAVLNDMLILLVIAALVTLASTVYVIYLLLQRGTLGPNKYGPNPLGITVVPGAKEFATTSNNGDKD